LPAIEDDRADQLARLVVEDQIGPEQVGATLIAAAQIDSVTGAAMYAVQAVAASNECRISRWSLLRGKGRTPATPTAGAAAATLGLRRSILSRWMNRDNDDKQRSSGHDADRRTHREYLGTTHRKHGYAGAM
jgi:hypothetical protein